MKTIIIILTLTSATHAQDRLNPLGSDGPGGVSIWHIDHWDVNGVHVDAPIVAPEPSSPLVMLVSAGLALIGKRSRKTA